jgi:transaldolase
MEGAMEIWLDTCEAEAIASANDFGIITGVTTNPSLLAEAREDPEKIIQAILDVQDGPVAVQITADESSEIIKRAHALRVFSDRIIIKIPVTQQGLIAMKSLSADQVPIMATTIFQVNQALLAALAGAEYIAPYVGRMLDAGIDAYESLRSMAAIYKRYAFNTKILAAALKTPEQIKACAEIGIEAVTLKPGLFNQFIAEDKNTLNSLKSFAEAWKESAHSTVLVI